MVSGIIPACRSGSSRIEHGFAGIVRKEQIADSTLTDGILDRLLRTAQRTYAPGCDAIQCVRSAPPGILRLARVLGPFRRFNLAHP